MEKSSVPIKTVPMFSRLLNIAYTFVLNSYVVGLVIYGTEYVLKLIGYDYSVLPYMAQLGISHRFVAYVIAGGFTSVLGTVFVVTGLGEVVLRSAEGFRVLPDDYKGYVNAIYKQVLKDAHWEGKPPALYLLFFAPKDCPAGKVIGGSIAVNRFAIENIDESYLKVLLAHEVAHVKNCDGQYALLVRYSGWFMYLLTKMLGGLRLILRFLFFSLLPAFFIGLVLLKPLIIVEIVSYVVNHLAWTLHYCNLALSREYELDADRFSAYVYGFKAVEYLEIRLQDEQEAIRNGLIKPEDPKRSSHPPQKVRVSVATRVAEMYHPRQNTTDQLYKEVAALHQIRQVQNGAPIESDTPLESATDPDYNGKIIYVKPPKKGA